MTANQYQLYHRDARSHGVWKLAIGGATSIDETTITFVGVEKAGQFLVTQE